MTKLFPQNIVSKNHCFKVTFLTQTVILPAKNQSAAFEANQYKRISSTNAILVGLVAMFYGFLGRLSENMPTLSWPSTCCQSNCSCIKWIFSNCGKVIMQSIRSSLNTTYCNSYLSRFSLRSSFQRKILFNNFNCKYYLFIYL